jgi:uncharacterized damage-inducible protein DinB
MKKDKFLLDLNEKLAMIDKALDQFIANDEKVLSHRPESNKWNVLECIEHLHRYNAFYLPEFQKTMKRAPLCNSNEMKRGRFGMKSAKSMLPGETGVNNPMKTFKSKNTLNTNVSSATLDLFRNELAELKALIQEAATRDIGEVKCKTTLPLIRFRLCDALEFVINHQVRHIDQAKRALKSAL